MSSPVRSRSSPVFVVVDVANETVASSSSKTTKKGSNCLITLRKGAFSFEVVVIILGEDDDFLPSTKDHSLLATVVDNQAIATLQKRWTTSGNVLETPVNVTGCSQPPWLQKLGSFKTLLRPNSCIPRAMASRSHMTMVASITTGSSFASSDDDGGRVSLLFVFLAAIDIIMFKCVLLLFPESIGGEAYNVAMVVKYLGGTPNGRRLDEKAHATFHQQTNTKSAKSLTIEIMERSLC